MKVMFLGPATQHLDSWLRGLQETGLDVQLVTLHRAAHISPRYPCFDLSADVSGGSKLHYFRAVGPIRALIAREKPHLLVSYYASSYGVLGRLTRFPIRVVATAGSDINVNLPAEFYRVPFLRFAFKGAAKVVCWSAPMKAALGRLRVPEEQIFVLPRGIEVDQFVVGDRPASKLALCCTRRFRRMFNHETLIRACGVLQQREVPFSLRLCGAGSEEARIRQLVDQHGLAGSVELLGDLPRDQVPAILGSSHVCVSLSNSDGASASLFEAFAAGCFPVASRVAANEAWIQDGVNGRLVDPTNADNLANVLTELSQHREQIEAAGRQNRAVAESQLDIRRNSVRYRALFEDLVRQ